MCVLFGSLRAHPTLKFLAVTCSLPCGSRGGLGWGRLCFSAPLHSPDHGLQ